MLTRVESQWLVLWDIEQNIFEKGIELFQEKEKIKPLPEGFSEKSPQPVINTTSVSQRKDPITNLTSTETALLSPTEKVIAGRT